MNAECAHPALSESFEKASRTGACHAHRLARRALYGVHANDGSAGMLKVPRIHGPLALQRAGQIVIRPVPL
jgi:hypothetical protein